MNNLSSGESKLIILLNTIMIKYKERVSLNLHVERQTHYLFEPHFEQKNAFLNSD